MAYESPSIESIGTMGNPSYGTCSVGAIVCVVMAVAVVTYAAAISVALVTNVAAAAFVTCKVVSVSPCC